MNDNNESVPEIILGSEAGAQAPLPARLDEVLPEQLLILPMSARPFFPAQTMPIASNQKLWLETIERVGKTPHRLLGLVYARNDDQNMPGPDYFAAVGTVVRVHNAAVSDGTV
ncbi:MAG: LON peptidase substrate-binding domain-containing protein, partial [Gammaproteobacteria bacterium]|nr:LON peptidase substrate-binding domain-containing protein [Gammaproteobacteria bacterium]